MTEIRSDVVVVGAGLAGLSAAELLVDHGLDVRILEARERVGGRTYSKRMAGESVDLGAEHVGPKHRRVRQLADRLGIGYESSGLLAAKTRWQYGGTDKVSALPPVPPRELAHSVRALARLTRLARHVPVETPWMAPSAAMYDRISLADWLDAERIEGRAREVHETIWRDGFTVATRRISMLHILWAARRSGGVLAAIRDTVGYHLEGGTQSLALGLARRLGSRVELEKPVATIEQDDDEVCVAVDNGAAYRARHALVCVPITTLSQIKFSPRLPDELEEAQQELAFGNATTIIVGHPAASDPGYGFVSGNEHLGVAWRRGPTAKNKFHDVAEKDVPLMARTLAEASGIPTAGLEVDSIAWSREPFSRGTYVNFAPGQLTQLGPHLRRPHGRVRFAAAERSTWPTFMEGAVESGQNTAADLVRIVNDSGRPGRRVVSARAATAGRGKS